MKEEIPNGKHRHHLLPFRQRRHHEDTNPQH